MLQVDSSDKLAIKMPERFNPHARRFGQGGRPLVATAPRAISFDGSTGGASPYKLGRAFERAIRGRLERKGYFVMRAHGSKGKIDLLAVGLDKPTLGVQCKRRSAPGSTEWNELMDLCEPYGIMPVVATKVSERTVAFYRLDERRIPRKPGRPWTEIDHATGEPLPAQMALT